MLELDFLEPLIEIFLVVLCWSPRGDGDCRSDCGAEKEIAFLGLYTLMGKRGGWLEFL
jgi:hypothetical protein